MSDHIDRQLADWSRGRSVATDATEHDHVTVCDCGNGMTPGCTHRRPPAPLPDAGGCRCERETCSECLERAKVEQWIRARDEENVARHAAAAPPATEAPPCPKDCARCSGEYCEQCGPRRCDHDTAERHEVSPAPEAPGEMSEAAPAVVASVYRTFRDMLREIESKVEWMRGSIAEVQEEYDKVRAAREAERQSAERWAKAADASTRERDEAREQLAKVREGRA